MPTRAFSFVPFGARAPEGAAACDGLVEGAALDLSHWQRNATPPELKRDTSVEIALAFAATATEREIPRVVNNHFDADGVLAVFALCEPERALAHRAILVAAAEAGDFDEWPREMRGLWLELAIAKLARGLDDRAAYARVLPALAELVSSIEAREDLWADGFAELERAGARARSGAVVVSSLGPIAIFRHAPGVVELPGPVLHQLVPPGALRTLLAFEAADGSFAYRYELPRWSWADTIERPRLRPPSRNAISRDLGPGFALEGGLGMTGLLRSTEPIRLAPEEVARRILARERFEPFRC